MSAGQGCLLCVPSQQLGFTVDCRTPHRIVTQVGVTPPPCKIHLFLPLTVARFLLDC